ncbi:MAG: Flp family type IVb pilin [Clostridiales bacterium]|nr:Flp family type IVb pilin [Clostridiales bacterium]
MKNQFAKISEFLQSEDGQGMVEYGLIIGLVAIALIVALTAFAPKIRGVFERAGTALDGAAPAP